ncbi:CAP domain-containing protein [Saccharothrix sp.]|uniref:CAP domain-containing protein n=1 Tax=Saccharothrix sp. TaxID=1873460 RepID=UPI002810ABAE|nr:CAP domain-containing protein [Saccharothrix sp.]
MKRSFFARGKERALVACAAAAVLAAVTAQQSDAQPANRVSAADRVVELVNAERAGAGCGAVKVDGRAQSAAQSHADDMAARDYYDHVSPEGRDAGDRLDAAGYPWRRVAENIHKGPTTPEDAMRDWMNSPGHRANILNCELHDLGVGVNTSGSYWVQVFASP